jgi:predicted dienelactone hydrolase
MRRINERASGNRAGPPFGAGWSSLKVILALCVPLLALSAVKLPQPDGPFPVSRQEFVWTDATRQEDAKIPDQSARHVAAFVFYPAATNGTTAAYYPGLANLKDEAAVAGLKAQFFGSWDDVRNGGVETNISESAPIAASNKLFPVLIFSPGLGVPALAYSIQLNELASQGYVIFALDHPYDTVLVQLPDGKSIAFADRHAPTGPPNATFFRVDAEREAVWTKDTQFALVQIQKLNSQGGLFQNRLDLSKLGIFGHSMGGRVAVQACQAMPEFSACLNQDGGLFGVDFRSGEVVPFINGQASTNGSLLNTDVPILAPGSLNDEGKKSFKEWDAKKAKLLQDFLQQNSKPTYSIVSQRSGFGHGSFMDVRFLNALSEHKDPTKSLSDIVLVNQVNLAFFDYTLKGKPDRLQELMRDKSLGLTIQQLPRP